MSPVFEWEYLYQLFHVCPIFVCCLCGGQIICFLSSQVISLREIMFKDFYMRGLMYHWNRFTWGLSWALMNWCYIRVRLRGLGGRYYYILFVRRKWIVSDRRQTDKFYFPKAENIQRYPNIQRYYNNISHTILSFYDVILTPLSLRVGVYILFLLFWAGLLVWPQEGYGTSKYRS